MLVFYASGDRRPDAQRYWIDYAKDYYERTKSLIKPNDDVKKLAATLTVEAKSDDEKLQRLFEFCRNKIKNVGNDASGATDEERAKARDNKNPADTLKRGLGFGIDINLL